MALKVYDLACGQGHLFEGWFGSQEDYANQQARGLLQCPLCGSTQIERRLSAPRLNVSGATAAITGDSGAADTAASGSAQSALATPEGQALQAEALRRMREFVRSMDNVGPRFAEEARRIHEGELPERPIRGTATPEERQSLADDGIGIMPIPDILDDDRLI